MLVYKQELLKNYATLQTLHKNGVAKASDVDKLHIEILNTDKQRGRSSIFATHTSKAL